ncbi:MAG: hypothetical protein LBG67_00115 [Campylobacteraceae bacterium]|nr:hypothetical protein [Campylobacteraceae bacterium]
MTKFMWVFYFMNSITKDRVISFSDNHLLVKSKDAEGNETTKEYLLKKAPKWKFLAAKYLFWAMMLFVIYTKYDFYPQMLLVWALSIAISIALVLTPRRNLMLATFVIFIPTIIYFIYSGNTTQISFIIKYTMTMFLLFIFFLDTKKVHYLLYENDELRANLIKDEEAEL